MSSRTISLRADLVDRLERLARAQGRTVDEIFDDLLGQFSPLPAAPNWALALAEAMEEAPIEWQDEPAASEHSRAHFERHLAEKWQRTQTTDSGSDE